MFIYSDSGIPFILSNPTSEVADKMIDLATIIIQEIDKLASATDNDNNIQYNSKNNIIYYPNDNHLLTPYKLRSNCRCATCVEEFTG